MASDGEFLGTAVSVAAIIVAPFAIRHYYWSTRKSMRDLGEDSRALTDDELRSRWVWTYGTWNLAWAIAQFAWIVYTDPPIKGVPLWVLVLQIVGVSFCVTCWVIEYTISRHAPIAWLRERL